MWDRLSGLDQVTLPIWAAGAAIILFLIVGIVAVWRAGPRTAIAASSQAALVLIVAGATWSFISQSSLRDRADERRALDARAMDLTARAVTPGSPLACLDALAGETVENACEKAVFASADSAAAAVSYIAARLTLLADATAYADRHDPSYELIVADWRRKLESDRFGLVAQVMATRDGCTGDQCEALRLLRDTSRVSANLKESAFEQNVARHASAWGTRAGTPVAAVTHSLAGGTLGDAFMHKVGKGTVITQTFFFYPDLSHTGQYRGTFNFGTVTKLNKWLGWQNSFADIYVSNPPRGTKQNDLQLATGLNVSFTH